MKYTFDYIEYEVEIKDLPSYGGYYKRSFNLSHQTEKGYCFHVKYTLENGMPKIHYVRLETGAFPEADQAEIFTRSILIEALPQESSN